MVNMNNIILELRALSVKDAPLRPNEIKNTLGKIASAIEDLQRRVERIEQELKNSRQ